MAIAPCPPNTPVVHGVVVFEPEVFKTKFPAFATVSNEALLMNFDSATLQLSNSCCSRVRDAAKRERLLNLLTAHITALFNGVNGVPPTGVVGRIAGAHEGSVSAQIGWDARVQQSQAWYLQTQWGALYWQSTLPYRTMMYVPPPRPSCSPFGFGGWGPGFGPIGNGNCGNNGGSA